MKNFLPLLLSVLVLTACSKKDPGPSVIIDAPTLELKYNQQHQYALKQGSEDILASTFTWKSSNENVGKVDANGRVTSRKIGEAIITGTSKNGSKVESKITVSPYMTFVTEPILEFGSTIANVKSKEKRKLVQETDDLLVYEGESSKVKLISYYKQNGKITSALLIFENITTTVMDVTTYFKERFPNHGLAGGNVVHLSDDRKYGIILSVNASLGFFAIYAIGNSDDLISNSEINIDFSDKLSKLLSE